MPSTKLIKRKRQPSTPSAAGEEKHSTKKRRQTNTRKTFEQRIEDLEAYKEKHGHVNVSQKEDKSLYDFCRNMRQARNNPVKSSKLNEERIASLDALGFDWCLDSRLRTHAIGSHEKPFICNEVRKRKSLSNSSSKEMGSAPPKKKRRVNKSFAQRIADLRAYKEKHGHVNVKEGEDKSLYRFCVDMRQAHKHPKKSTMTITDDRIRCLDALGFEWSINEHVVKKSFEQRIEDLRAYKERHGHIRVKQSDDTRLYNFCFEMRRARNNPGKSTTLINKEHIASLDALGFDWTERTREQAAKKSFEQRIGDLQAYKEKHGHVNVRNCVDTSLYKFCQHMRRARKNPEKSDRALTEDRITSLDALGFDWTVMERETKSFEQRIADLKAYKEKNGHVNVKEREDKRLYGFCKHTRYARNNPEKSTVALTDDRITSLDALGFDWRISILQMRYKCVKEGKED